jgi:hypothetical protein
MKKELQDKLFNDFPTLYRDRALPETVSRMCDGFCCGNGWFDIIYELSKQIHEFCLKHNLTGDNYVRVFQVKQKLGSLSYYLEDVKLQEAIDKELHELIMKATSKAAVTCEVCGKPGELCEIRNWYNTLCPIHKDQCENR